jgi:hypothetical protein
MLSGFIKKKANNKNKLDKRGLIVMPGDSPIDAARLSLRVGFLCAADKK